MIYAIGAFDGFHLGHLELLKKAEALASENNEGWGIVTFSTHPQEFFRKSEFRYLFSDYEKSLLRKFYSIENVVALPFDTHISSMEPEAFIQLLSEYDVTGIVVGENFRFGRDRKGTPELLRAVSERNGWKCETIKSLEKDSGIVCSSRIRECVTEGNLDEAVSLLGFPFIVSGTVVKGKQRGRELGFPTANIENDPKKLYPEQGSYAGFTFIEERLYPVAFNSGLNPTFGDIKEVTSEAHIIGYDGDLYGQRLEVFLFSKNREEKKFENIDLLVNQLCVDINNIKEMFDNYLEDNKELIERISLKIFDM